MRPLYNLGAKGCPLLFRRKKCTRVYTSVYIVCILQCTRVYTSVYIVCTLLRSRYILCGTPAKGVRAIILGVFRSLSGCLGEG